MPEIITYGQGLKIRPLRRGTVIDDRGVETDEWTPGTKPTDEWWVRTGEWALVQSSNVAAIQYDRQARSLTVEFLGTPPKPNSIYAYQGVEEMTARQMFNCSSMGSFVHQRLKGKYAFRRIA